MPQGIQGIESTLGWTLPMLKKVHIYIGQLEALLGGEHDHPAVSCGRCLDRERERA
jgi:hypothetical protein